MTDRRLTEPTMTDSAALLAMLRHGDSAFPGGGASFSWGLETLVQDGLVRSAGDLERFIDEQLRRRWATSDRCALLAAWDADGDLARIGNVDRVLENRTLARELRDGSRRAGGALLSVHARLGTRDAALCQAALAKGAVLGHLATMQGLLWQRSGVGREQAVLMAAHSYCLATTGAAVRLGVVGHVDAQRIVGSAAATIAGLAATDAPPLDEIHAFAPLTEIAAMRHETGDTRLFSN